MRARNRLHRPKPLAARGFTLAELLVALTMSALLAMAAVAALRAGLQISNRIEAASSTNTSAQRVLQMMSVELSGMYAPQPVSGELAVQLNENDRGERKFTFFTTAPGWSRGGLAGRCSRITYTFKQPSAAGRGELVREEQLVAGEEPIAEPVTEQLATGLDSFNVQLFDQAGEAFQANKESTAALPRRATISIKLADISSEATSYTSEVYIPANTTLLAGKPAESQAAS